MKLQSLITNIYITTLTIMLGTCVVFAQPSIISFGNEIYLTDETSYGASSEILAYSLQNLIASYEITVSEEAIVQYYNEYQWDRMQGQELHTAWVDAIGIARQNIASKEYAYHTYLEPYGIHEDYWENCFGYFASDEAYQNLIIPFPHDAEGHYQMIRDEIERSLQGERLADTLFPLNQEFTSIVHALIELSTGCNADLFSDMRRHRIYDDVRQILIFNQECHNALDNTTAIDPSYEYILLQIDQAIYDEGEILDYIGNNI